MKLALYSDLHLEMITHLRGTLAWEPPPLVVDAVILAGDIWARTRGMEWAIRAFPEVPHILYVAGNHEYYETQLGLLDELRNPSWEKSGIHFLEQRCLEFSGVRFLGCTLWSGFDLYGTEQVEPSMAIARRSINDYWDINARNGKRLKPSDTLKLHRSSVRWLDQELAKPFDGKTVVITHFAPHPRCVAPQFQGGDVSPYFVTDLSWLMAKYKIDIWCYGHTHTNISFEAENGCRVISNQKGYPRESVSGFEPHLMIEV